MNIKPQESGIEMPSESSNDLDITLMASELDQLRDENQRLHKHYATLMKASNDDKNDLCRKYQTQLHQSNETYAQLKEDLSMQRIEADEQRIFLKNAMSEKEQVIALKLITYICWIIYISVWKFSLLKITTRYFKPAISFAQQSTNSNPSEL